MNCRAINLMGYGCSNLSIWKGFCNFHGRLDSVTNLPQWKSYNFKSDNFDVFGIRDYFINGFRCEIIYMDYENLEIPILIVRAGLRKFAPINQLEKEPQKIKDELEDLLKMKLEEDDKYSIRVVLGSPERYKIRFNLKINPVYYFELYRGDILFIPPDKIDKLILKSVFY